MFSSDQTILSHNDWMYILTLAGKQGFLPQIHLIS